MEIGENVESKTIHSVQSVPILSAAESSGQDEVDGGNKKDVKSRRVSFASSTHLAQYLEPINPFDSLGECRSCLLQSPFRNLYKIRAMMMMMEKPRKHRL